jgi:transcriptional regulator with XRE-family HTH domain
MTAAEARKRRGGSTLLERAKADPTRAARIDRLVAAASVEQLVQAIMERERISAAELARRIHAKAPQISRDLHGGLSRATLSRVSAIAEALGYDFVPAFVPRSDTARRKRFLESYAKLIPEAAQLRLPVQAAPQKKRSSTKAKTSPAGRRRIA